jgi:hypothetical protein
MPVRTVFSFARGTASGGVVRIKRLTGCSAACAAAVVNTLSNADLGKSKELSLRLNDLDVSLDQINLSRKTFSP